MYLLAKEVGHRIKAELQASVSEENQASVRSNDMFSSPISSILEAVANARRDTPSGIGGCFRNYPQGGGPQALFCPGGGGFVVDNVSKGWGSLWPTLSGGWGG